jgi:hypothetical protein
MGKAFEENEFTHNLGLDQNSATYSAKHSVLKNNLQNPRIQ